METADSRIVPQAARVDSVRTGLGRQTSQGCRMQPSKYSELAGSLVQANRQKNTAVIQHEMRIAIPVAKNLETSQDNPDLDSQVLPGQHQLVVGTQLQIHADVQRVFH